MSLIKEYFDHCGELEKTYGNQSIVLMQVGSFYEVYGFRNKTNGNIWGSRIEDFKTICDFQISEKSGNAGIPENNVLMMAGFPESQIEKYVGKLQSKNYTIAVYKQVKVGKNHERKLDVICSPGTYFNNNDTTDKITNYITCIRFFVRDKSAFNLERKLIIGISSVDIITGSSKYNEYAVPYIHNPCTYDFIERYLSIDYPSELVVLYNSSVISYQMVDDIIQFIGVSDVYQHRVDMDDIGNESSQLVHIANRTEKQNIQYEILQHYFKPNDILSFIHEHQFDLYCIASHSLCFLLEFINIHNHNLVEKLIHPNKEYRREHLYLANHSLKQLNIISDERHSGHKGSVLSFINKCITPMGKRYFKEQLLHPITDVDVLNSRYDAIEYIFSCREKQTNKSEYLTQIRQQLKGIVDMDKILRSVVLENSKIKHIMDMKSSLTSIQQWINKEEYTISFDYPIFQKQLLTKQLKECSDYLEKVFNIHYDTVQYDHQSDDIENGKLYTFSYFNKGVYKELDNVLDEWIHTVEKLHTIRDYFSNVIKSAGSSNKRKQHNQSYCKIHHMEKNGYYLRVTNSRAEILKKELKNKDNIELEYQSYYTNGNEKINLFLGTDLHMSIATGGEKKISTPYIDHLTIQCKALREKTIGVMTKYYLHTMDHIKNKLYESFLGISKTIAIYDFIINNANHALEYHYCRPEIVNSDDISDSFVEATEIRHPLIEVLLKQETYVANDIKIGTMSTKGLLLYGTNAVGKSSYIKSIGISVIMAQAGCFVPCSTFRYRPYHKLFTRILGNDNIFKGLSTFAVEMSELKVILNNTDENSLVLGDELCSGTETGSAISLFVSGLLHLSKLKSSYLFATHFHEITSMEEIQKLCKEQLAIKHLSVQYCPEEDTLLYDRILRDGPGNNLYGLEVCRSLHLPKQFLDMASNIRYKLNDKDKGISERRQSRYNSGKLKTNCEICGNKSDEIHHLKPQKDADEEGYVGYIHKNHLGNLVSLCEKCHDLIHREETDKELKKCKTTEGYVIKEK